MKKKHRLFLVLLWTLSVTPAVVSAQFSLENSTFSTVVDYAISILDIVIPILSSLAFVAFFWGLSKFILSGSGNPAGLKKGKEYMMWGILALFILLSFRAIISMVSTDLEIKNPNNTSNNWRPQLPQ